MGAAVDLVIPNLDGEALLGACLEGVAAQTLAPARVIVVDSGSVDGSRAIAEAHGAEWHALPANKGFAAAVNHGIAISDSPYVALLNNDAVPEPGWLEAMVDALERDPGALVRGLAHALHRRARHERRRRRLRRARPRRLQPRHPRARRPALRRAAHRLRRLRRAPRSTAARCSTTSASSTSSSSSRGRTSTSICAPRSPATAACTCRRPSCTTPRARRRATGGRRWSAATRRSWRSRACRCRCSALYLTLLPAREAYETRAAREGVRDYLRRLAPYATRGPARSLRRRGEVRRRTGVRELWPLLTRESLPYEPPPRSR